MDDKSFLVQITSITDSSKKEVDCVEGGSMKDNTTLRQFNNDAYLIHVAKKKHGDVASSASSQGCQETKDNGFAILYYRLTMSCSQKISFFLMNFRRTPSPSKLEGHMRTF